MNHRPSSTTVAPCDHDWNGSDDSSCLLFHHLGHDDCDESCWYSTNENDCPVLDPYCDAHDDDDDALPYSYEYCTEAAPFWSTTGANPPHERDSHSHSQSQSYWHHWTAWNKYHHRKEPKRAPRIDRERRPDAAFAGRSR